MLKHLWLAGVLLSLLWAWMPAHSAEPENTEIRILVDISGSMQQTDPNNLRIPAVNLLIELIPEGATAGIWTFGQYVNRLLPPATVNDQWRRQARLAAQQINSAGLFTNLPDALNDASIGLVANSAREQSVIMLTDGYVDMPDGRNQHHKQRLIRDVLPKLVNSKTKVHSLALSNDVDKPLLQEISAATQGLYLEAHESSELMRAFLKAFDRTVPSEQVPLRDNGFNIDSSVTEFTALVFRGASGHTQLIAPSGKKYDSNAAQQLNNIRWHHDIGFELITIQAPEPGHWQVDAEQDPDNRVQVLSDLKLMVQGVPATLFAGTPVTMKTALTDHEQIVRTAEVLRNTDFILTVAAPDGRVGRKVLSNKEHLPESGIYSEEFTRLDAEGEYQFTIEAVGKTFERKQTLAANLIAPLKLRQQELLEQEQLLLLISPEESVDPILTRLHISLVAPNGHSQVHDLRYDKQANAWSYRVEATQGPGRYQIDLAGRIVLHSKAKMNYRPGSISVNFPLALAANAPQKPQAVVHKNQPEQSAAGAANKLGLPDLAAAYQAQQEALAQQQTQEQAAEPELEDQDGSSLWLYVVIAMTALLAIAAAVFVLLRKRQAKPATSEPAAEDATAATADLEPEVDEIPEDLIQEDIEELQEQSQEEPQEEPQEEIGDFDSFSGDEEVEIPMPNLEGTADDESSAEDLFANLDRDFSIDPDEPNL